jgi:3-oxoacyl-[acyl-carrier protein] reductase
VTIQPRIVLVSGGSRGLGQALVTCLLEDGYSVATFSRTRTGFIDDCTAADPKKINFYWEQLDASDCDQVSQFALSVFRRFGRIDSLINNAGVAPAGVLALMRPELMHQTITLNLESALRLAQSCSRIMLTQKSGSIINISSISAIRGFCGLAVYSATKAALDAFTRSLARELGPRGICVNAVAPGYLPTQMSETLTEKQRRQIINRTPLRRLGTVEDVVGVVRFLLSPAAQFMTGQILTVDGGMTC